MKKAILFLFMSLLMTGSAFARCQMYIDDFTVTPDQIGSEIVLGIKAELSARVNTWQLDLTYPEGMTPTYAELGDDGYVPYINSKGRTSLCIPYFLCNTNYTELSAVATEMGYMYDSNAGSYITYGNVKWEGGTYDEMVLLYVQVSEDFHGGEIIMNTTCTSSSDERGGTIRENGDHGVTFTTVCSVSVEGSAPPEAYACYTSSNTTLSFYYDNLRAFRSGTTYDLNTGHYKPGWASDLIEDDISPVTNVVFNSSFANARPSSTYAWFRDMKNLTSITGMQYLNTSEVTNMSWMFHNCESLRSLDLSSFNTANVTDMTAMFNLCVNLESLNLSSFNTAKVTEMSFMFDHCKSLESLDVSSFNTANVTDMRSMFYVCVNLKSLNLSNFNTANVANMKHMFGSSSHLKSLDLSSFNTSEVTDMSWMFHDCDSLESLDLSGFNTAKVTNMESMFSSCNCLKTIYVGDGWSTAAVTTSSGMFSFCNRLVGGMGTTYDANHVDAAYAHIDGGTSDPGYLTGLSYVCYTPENTTLTFYYDKLRSTRSGTTYGLNTGTDAPGWYADGNYLSVTRVMFDMSFVEARPTSTYLWFYGMSNLKSITNLYCLNTESVTDMTYMFCDCRSLTSLNVSTFNTANVTSFGFMFCDCSGLESLDLSSFSTEKVLYFTCMFKGCTGLTSLDLSSFNTSSVKNMSEMFRDCSGLESLDLSSFNTSNVTNMTNMFNGCTGLESLDLSSFNTSNVTMMGLMFYNCSGLTTIYVNDGWSTSTVNYSNNMFKECTSLVGGMGTTYNANHVDKAYARIDGGSSRPGYFTEKGPEAYAVFTPDNTTLSFYCDNHRSTRTGTSYLLNTGKDREGWIIDNNNTLTTQVVFDPSFAAARPATTMGWFSHMANLQSITGMEYLNTDSVTDMSAMFYGCGMENIDVGHFNTANVTNFSFMFMSCPNLSSLDLSNFNTDNATNFGFMFVNCPNLSSLDLSSFNTDNVQFMTSMFAGCLGLTSLDLSHFNTAKVTDMEGMFYSCTNLTTIYVGDDWSTAIVDWHEGMFGGCTSLVGGKGTTFDPDHIDKTYAHIDGGPSNPGYFSEKLTIKPYVVYTPDNTTLTFYYDDQCSARPGTIYEIGDNWTSTWRSVPATQVVFDPSFADARPTFTGFWFGSMPSLTSITGMEYLNTSEVTKMYAMFRDNTGLTTLDLSSFNTSNVTSMNLMFYGCTNLTTIYVGNEWSIDAVTESLDMFKNCTSLVGGMGTTYDANHVDKEYAHIDYGPSNPGYFSENLEGADPIVAYDPENTTLTFYYGNGGASRSATTFVLNEGNNMPEWFTNGINESVTRVVFEPSFAYARPTSTYAWFLSMENLQSIEGIEYLNTSEVTKMGAMFMGCSNLTSLDVSYFDTEQATDMFHMFYGCSNLTSLDVSNFNTAQVDDMRGMFRECSNLTSLDLSGFNTARATNMSMMFNGDSRLTTIYVGNGWSTATLNYSNEMFSGCTSLVGGKGTTYDANHVDAEYAHIDGGSSNPGYFTAKVDFMRGDVDNSGEVKIADVTALINYLLSGDASAINLSAADCDQNGEIKIADVTALINYLLSGSW